MQISLDYNIQSYAQQAAEKVMEQKEHDAPFHHRQVQPAESPGTEIPGIVDILSGEKVACRDEKERHMEGVYKICDQFGSLGMSGHHQNDGYPLGYRHSKIAHKRMVYDGKSGPLKAVAGLQSYKI